MPTEAANETPPMLHHLPYRSASAAVNMAEDLLLLENYGAEQNAATFRHYGWSEPAFTFGLSQSWPVVRATLPADCALVRRASGGGVVSHLNDWTYALTVPFAQPLCRERATVSYKKIHQAIADALTAQGVAAALVPCPGESCDAAEIPPHKPGVCFVLPEIYDVVRPDDGRKIAGAAQKRNRHGLLVQGSIAREMAPELDWTLFEKTFAAQLSSLLNAEEIAVNWPIFPEEMQREAVARFASREWNERH